MNLLEVQDRLNKLPPRPESIQYLTAAAQGGNPQVPPYMALARIGEMNKQMKDAQNKPQPPAEPLNQSLPKQALQSMGIGALPQGMPQGMPQGAPQGMAQAAPQQAPEMQAPQGMAEGGLAGLPVDPRMFEYGSGGVVAFANPENDQVVKDETAVKEETAVEDDDGYDAEAELKKLMPQIQALMKQGVRPVSAPADIEKKLRESKEYGIESGPIGKGYLEGLASLEQAKDAERAKQQADINERRRLSHYKGNLDWSDASRGQTGMGGVGALGRNYIGSVDKFLAEETELREDAIKQKGLMNEAQYKMQTLRQAQLKGDVAGEYKAQADLAKLAKDMHISNNTLMARLVTGNLNLMGKYETAQASRDVAATRAKAKANASGKSKAPSNEAAGVAINAARLKEEHPDWSDARIQAEALRQYKTTATAPATAVRENTEMQKAWAKEQYNPDYRDLSPENKKVYERTWKQEYLRKNPEVAGPAPAAAPAASTTPPPPPGFKPVKP